MCHKNASGEGKTYNETGKKHQKYFWNVIVLQEKSQSGVRKLNRIEKQER